MRNQKGHDMRRSWTGYLALTVVLVGIACDEEFDRGDLCPLDYLVDQAVLDAEFRVDISTIATEFNVYPEEGFVEADATVTFRMRPGQHRARIHFDPAFNHNWLEGTFGEMNTTVTGTLLNGEALDIQNPADVSRIESETSLQPALEFQRELIADGAHTLELTYRIDFPLGLDVLASWVNDIAGEGNEVWFPTINSPQELARHRLTFNIHSDREYAFIGSGLVEQSATVDHQQFTLDTEREIASYTVMWVLIPRAEVQHEERVVQGVDVRIMAFKENPDVEEAYAAASTALEMLQRDLGPFPMPRGLSIFLMISPDDTNQQGFGVGGWGMEYFGATNSGVGVLIHEIVHMYFGCSLIAKTYRDSWWDEAATVWYLGHVTTPIDDNYYSDMVGGQHPTDVGFNTDAYTEGAMIIAAMAEAVGSREQLVAFFADLHQTRAFEPFDTMELLDYFYAFSGIDLKPDFIWWLYSEPCS